MRNKTTIVVDPLKDPRLLQVLNELSDKPYYKIEYGDKTDRNIWQRFSSKITNHPKCKKLIDDDFIEPPSTNRYRSIGYIIKKSNVDIIKEPFGKKTKFILSRKIF